MIREPKFKKREQVQDPVRILLVEDDPLSAELLHAQLRSMPFVQSRLEVVGTLADALAKLASDTFGLVLTDLHLPDSAGLGTVEALAVAAEQPIIVLSGDRDPTLRMRCIECGAYDFLSKDQLTAATLARLMRLAAIQSTTLRLLRESRARFTDLLKLSSDWYWEQDEQFRYTRFEGRVDELLASDSRADLGLRRWEIPTNEPVAGTWEEHRAALGAHLPFRNFETRRLGDDGKVHYLIASGDPVFDRAGRFCGYSGVASDITSRSQAESALQRSEALFRQTFELAGSGIAHIDLDGVFLRANRRLCEILGYQEKELIGRSVKQISHPEDRDVTDGQRARLRAGELESVQMEKRYLHRDGRTVWVELTVALARDAQGAPLYEISIMEDVTERKAAEAALRDSEARFRSLTELSADFYWETDAEHRVLRTSHGPRHRPISAAQVGKKRWELPSTQPDAAGWVAHRAMLDAHVPFRDFELARLDAEGVERHLSISGAPVSDAAGRFTGYRGVGKEITQRKREEALLRLEHEVTRCLAEAESAGAGLRAVIRAICETQNWECGRYFGWDERAAALSLQEFWHVPNAALEAFIVKSRALSYQPGIGLIGQAYQSVDPLWVKDLANDPRVKAGLALDASMHGAFLFAATSAGKPIGVFVFHSRQVREPDNRLLDAVRVIGSQVGQLIQRRHAESRRHEIELQFRRTFELVGTGLAHIGLDRRFIRVNRRLCEIFGYSEAELLGRAAKEFSHPDDLDVINEQRPRLYAGELDAVRGEKRYLRKDGSVVWLAYTLAVERDSQGKALYEITAYDDVTDRKRAEQRQAAHLHHQQRIARFGQSALAKREPAELVDDAVQTVLEALAADAVAYLEPGPGGEDVVLRALVGVADAQAGAAVPCAPQAAIHRVLHTGTRMLGTGADLALPWARGLQSAAFIPVRGELAARGALCVLYRQADAFTAEGLNFSDAAASVLSTGLQRIDSEARLAYLAQFDPLTGLPNRTLLADRFSQIIVQAKRRDSPLAVLFIDLDEFKMVNDTLGHAGGDALLKEVAVRLQSTVRSGDTVARISGDEFAIVLAELARPEDAAIVAQKVIDRLSAAVEVHGKEVFVTASVGIAAFPGDGKDAEALLGAADAAMYRAKQSGRNAYQFFTAEINQRSRARSHMGSELRRALEREEFALVYQPKYDLETRRPKGAEALLRWKHPERGTVSPADFIPVLEETGLIVPVGDWVLRRVCHDVKAWRAAGFEPGPVSVNLSARQFRQHDLDDRIRAVVAAAGIDPALIELEITESQLMQDPDHAIRVMRALCDAGMRIAIDDFGTGYSSLAYLTRFPVRSLKIDRSFVKNMLGDAGDATIVRTIIEMAHSLRFTVVAEGVETEEQAGFLRLLRCEQAQGFLFARPMPAEDLARACAA